LDAGYYLGQEIPRAAEALKAKVKRWAFDPLRAEGQAYRALLEEIKEFRPELVLTVNHLGLDAQGLLVNVFARLGLPIASWFVDSPIYILEPGPQGDAFVFSWDLDYVEPLKALGFDKVDYLPLATDPHYFAPKKASLVREAAFVGDSLTAATEKYLRLSGLSQGHLPQIDSMAKNFLKNEDLIPDRLAPALVEREGLSPTQARSLWALITWRASRLYRVKILKALIGPGLSVHGDSGWLSLLPGASLGGQLGYYRDLADFYRSTAVNLNVTSAQMKTGLNQRVFDAPAAGGFLLTDSRAQLANLFAPDEYVAYDGPAEAKALMAKYLRLPKERERIVAKAQARIFGEHVYARRLEKIFRRVFGSQS
jgi:spore maturation protein CgeB